MKQLRLFISLVTLNLLSCLALASSDGVSGIFFNYHDLFWRIINFSIYATIIVWIYKKYIKKHLLGYSKNVSDEINNVYKNLEKSEGQLVEKELEFKKLTNSMKSTFEKNISMLEKERKLSIQEAGLEIEKIEKKVEQDIENMRQSVKNEIASTILLESTYRLIERLQLQDEESLETLKIYNSNSIKNM